MADTTFKTNDYLMLAETLLRAARLEDPTDEEGEIIPGEEVDAHESVIHQVFDLVRSVAPDSVDVIATVLEEALANSGAKILAARENVGD